MGARPGMRVLLIGASGIAPVPDMKALAGEGASCVLAIERGAASPARHSRYCDEVWELPPIEAHEAFLGELLGRLERHRVDVLLPLSDQTIHTLAPVRAQIEALAAYAAPSPQTIAESTDKGRAAAILAGRDDVIAPPATFQPNDPRTAAEAWQGRFPVLVKPRQASGTRGVTLARDRGELDAVYKAVHADYELPILQEHLDYPPGGKLSLDYVFDPAGRRTSQIMTPVIEERALIGLGTGKERRRGGIALTFETAHDEDLLDRGMRTLQAFNWRGFGFLEAVLDPRDGVYRTVDINPRLPGGGTLSLQLGINFTYDTCLVALGDTPPDRLSYPVGERARRSADVMLRARSWRSALQIFDPRYRAPTNLIDDPRPVAVMTMNLASEALGSLRRRVWQS